jgi:chromosomal replication initiation ATPase DnaA
MGGRYSSGCPHCNARFPIRCTTDGCESLVFPPGNTHYDEPTPWCRTCTTQSVSQSRESLIAQIPELLRKASTSDYWKLPHRDELDDKLAAWIKGSAAFPNFYIKGGCGVGKTVAAARAAHFLITKGKVHSVLWCREYEMVQWAKSRWKNEGIGEVKLARAAEVELLVVDELFFRPGGDGNYHTEKERAALADLFCKRFEDITKRTIMVSNEMPMFSGVYDPRAMSRFEGSTEYVEVKGSDMRRRRGNDRE